MVKGKLQAGDPIFCVKVEHLITATVFEKALAQNYWEIGENFPDKLSKKESEEILRHRLFFYGNQGCVEDGHFEYSSPEYFEPYNNLIEKAEAYLRLKFPYLYDK